nr:hypothetical protein [Tanacetum cinerariifolium]
MASVIPNNQKFNFSKYILNNLKKNLEAGVPFYMFPRFDQVFVNHQIGVLSHHTSIFCLPLFYQEGISNMEIVETRLYEVVTPLFYTMMVQLVEEMGDLPTADQDTPIPDAPSSSQPQRKHKPRRKEKKDIKENEVLDLENEVIEMKSSHKAKIAGLESRVEKLEEENRSLTKEIKSVNSNVDSLAYKETVMDKEKSSKQGRKITDIDTDAEVNLENVYNLDFTHEETVLSIHDATDADGKEVVEVVVEVITIAKLIVDEVSTAGGELNAIDEELVSDAPSKAQVKDKGKSKLVEEPKVLKSRKAQIAIDEEVA